MRETKNIVRDIYKGLSISDGEINAEISLIFDYVTNMSSKELLLKNSLEEEQKNKIIEIAKKRVNSKRPIQQIIGVAYFMGQKFKVNEFTLIPRDETEILVREAVNLIKNNNFDTVLDIGTGSGCIACMIAKLTRAYVLGVDISTDALGVALDNTSSMELFNRAVFRKSDIFSNVKEKFNLIVSNPPYIPKSEEKNLQKEVLFDPPLALFTADEDGVEFYFKIIEQSSSYLQDNGYLLFELGINQSGLVADCAVENGFKVIKTVKDLVNIDRVIVLQKN